MPQVIPDTCDIMLGAGFKGEAIQLLQHEHILQRPKVAEERINRSRPNSVLNVRPDTTHKNPFPDTRNRKCINPSEDLADLYLYTLCNHHGSGLSPVSR